MNTMVRRMTLFAILVTVVLATGTKIAYSHHAVVMYDLETEITLEGVVKKFQFTNPHSWLLVDVTNEDGTVTTWGFESEGPSTLMRKGIRKGDFPPGMKITVSGHPLKDGRPAAAWTKAILEDGRRISPGDY